MNNWGIYQRLMPFGFGGEYNYVALNGYESMSQPNSITQEQDDAAWEKAAAGTPDEYIDKLTNETRVMVTSELWRHVMGVAATE